MPARDPALFCRRVGFNKTTPPGVHSVDWDRHRPPNQRVAMSDKSPRQAMTKKSGKSLKEKRAEKRSKDNSVSQTEGLVHKKR
jgi:hypothetical protein